MFELDDSGYAICKSNRKAFGYSAENTVEGL